MKNFLVFGWLLVGFFVVTPDSWAAGKTRVAIGIQSQCTDTYTGSTILKDKGVGNAAVVPKDSNGERISR